MGNSGTNLPRISIWSGRCVDANTNCPPIFKNILLRVHQNRPTSFRAKKSFLERGLALSPDPCPGGLHFSLSTKPSGCVSSTFPRIPAPDRFTPTRWCKLTGLICLVVLAGRKSDRNGITKNTQRWHTMRHVAQKHQQDMASDLILVD